MRATLVLAAAAFVSALWTVPADAAEPRFFPGYMPNSPFQTPPVLTGYNPFTGGFHTHTMTYYPSVNDPFRAGSMLNGSLQQVTRPVTDSTGRPVGTFQGLEWRNSVTGQIHSQGTTFSDNGMGGTHSNFQIRSGFTRP